MKKAQWLLLAGGLLATVLIYQFGKTVPEKKPVESVQHSEDDGHDHGPAAFTIDTIMMLAKKQLRGDQVSRVEELEASARSENRSGRLAAYHQLSHFWSDSVGIFEPFAWYEAEAARLENSEKSLTFAARLFLDNLQRDQVPGRRKWKALQAKDLFERSLKLNPGNDSSKIGLGEVYLFGGITEMPMEGIRKIREVAERDSTNVYAQLSLARGSVVSGQYDRAKERLMVVYRLQPENVDALLMLADVAERKGNKREAIEWYDKSFRLVKHPEAAKAIADRINELKK